MKKNLILICLSILLTLPTLSIAQCQLCYLNAEQAQKAKEYLEIKKEIILYAGCSNDEVARKVLIEKVSFRPVKDKTGYYEIFVEGSIQATFNIYQQRTSNYSPQNLPFDGVIDIAYAHVRAGGYRDPQSGESIWDATCLGIYLGYDCDPCVDPFDYPVTASR